MARSANDRPNVLVIMSDEHNAGVMGCAGDAIVRTPNLDALADGGVTFDAAYCNSPLCVPSRLAFTACRYVSRTGAWNNSCWLPREDYPSIAGAMTGAGYESLLCGRMHYDATRRYGFRVVGGDCNDYHKRGRGGRRQADDASVDTAMRDSRFADFRPGEHSNVLDHDRKIFADGERFLLERRPGDGPFFMLLSFLAPHFPLIVPAPYWRRYQGRVPMPEIPDGHLDSLVSNYQHLRRGFGIVEADPALVRRGRELYLGLTEWMDEQVGRLLAALASSGLAENTVVLYTSDHGENMGEHGLWWKNCMFESAARVPLIARWPGRWPGGQHRGGACSLLDVVRTIAAIGGAEPGDEWDGDSMLDWLDDADSGWKDRAVSEYFGHNIASGFAMIRQGRTKYVYHSPPDEGRPGERELYDLADDPGEFTNLASDAAHAGRVERMHAALSAELGDPDENEQRCRADTARGYGR